MGEARSFSKMDDKSASFDSPPMSRLFIICNKSHSEEDFQKSFEKYGKIEDIWIVKDKQTGDNKGVAYVKFNKTSEAALALEELNGKCIGDSDRPIKVLVAANRQDGAKKQDNESEKYVRLFVVVPKIMTEEELTEEFEKYGDVEKVQIVRDKSTGQPKGVGYVRFHRFLHAALAYENCPAKYKAVFANPKAPRNSAPEYMNMSISKMESGTNFIPQQRQTNDKSSLFRMQNTFSQPTSLNIVCSNQVNQDQLWRLFDVIPGLDYCQINGESGQNCNNATVVYTNQESAHYAKEKLHGLEYPPGHRLIIKLSGDSIQQSENSNSYREHSRGGDSLCSVTLPPPAPMADSKADVAQRCFIVVSSHLSDTVLKHVFCSFGNLIEVYLLPNKNCGYAKYATRECKQGHGDTKWSRNLWCTSKGHRS